MEDLTSSLKSNRKHKKGKSKKSDNDHSKKTRKNNRAFNVSNVVSTKRAMQRNLDRAQKKEVVPLINRTEETPPPSLVVVMGPKGVGKSTLIRSLVKMFTNQNLVDTVGPVTVVAGKKKRITFFEAPLDIYSLTDLAKVADLVVLMIDASYGLEMDTFEYINMLQVHGFPKVVGALTHMDLFKSNKSLQAARKAIKHRFWTEIYKGAKMFDFMGVVNGKYRKHEVQRLALQLQRSKYRPLIWRNSHPYLLCDRVEDVTPLEEQDGEERVVALFGYVRGTALREGQLMHLLGGGDFSVQTAQPLADPCPLPRASADDPAQRLRLSRKRDHLLYAPLANVGRVSMDSAGETYIELRQVHYTKPSLLAVGESQQAQAEEQEGEEGDPMEMVRRLQDASAVDHQLKKRQKHLRLFASSEDVTDEDDEEEEEEEEEENNVDDDDDDDEGEEEEESDDEGVNELDGGEGYAGYDDYEEGQESEDEDMEVDGSEQEEDNEDDDNEEEEEDEEEADNGDEDDYSDSEEEDEQAGPRRVSTAPVHEDIMALVYGPQWASSGRGKGAGKEELRDDDDDDGSDSDESLFLRPSSSHQQQHKMGDRDALDSSRCSPIYLRYYVCYPPANTAHTAAKAGVTDAKGTPVERYRSACLASAENEASDKRRVGWWYRQLKSHFVTGGYGQQDDEEGEAGDGEGSAYGDWEDLEASQPKSEAVSKSAKAQTSSDEEEEEEDDVSVANEEIDKQLRELNAQKKSAFKQSFDLNYDQQKGEGGSRKKKGADGEEEGEEEDGEGDGDLIKKLQVEQQSAQARSRAEFQEDPTALTTRVRGMPQGSYVRVLLRGLSSAFLTHFHASRPVILGGVPAGSSEGQQGYLQCRAKRHRWCPQSVLKSQDPLIISLGWRRFQTMPVYGLSNEGGEVRQRYLKYTPQHMHCDMTFYGPLVPPNTPFCAYQAHTPSTVAHYRIALTGIVLEQVATPAIMKKLKLVGTPLKVFKKNAFIDGMFNSPLEVSRCLGAKLKTVSGVRGAIKKAVLHPSQLGVKGAGPGTFRATFEDKILMR
eukprot:scaffold9386_cov154-Ochromonas_danica.AAC.14